MRRHAGWRPHHSLGGQVVIVSVISYVHIVTAGLVVGKVALLSFVVAPCLATTLEREPFRNVVRVLFPAYYAFGAGAAGAGILSVAALSLVRGVDPGFLAAGTLWLFILSAESYCRSWLTPRSNAMRDQLNELGQRGEQDAVLQSAWDRLHRRSVHLNSLVLIAGLCVIGLGMGFR